MQLSGNVERSMPLKEECNVTHSSPRNERHGTPCRAHGKALVSVRGKKGTRGWYRLKPLLGFPWERQGRVNSLGLACCSNSSRLWGMGALPAYLLPVPGLI